MQRYDVITVPDPVLREVAAPVERVDEGVRARLLKLQATMIAANGIGLAANQVGLLERIIVADVAEGSWVYDGEEDGALRVESQRPLKIGTSPLLMINPEVVWKDDRKSVFVEGCLSIPEQYADVVRPASVRVAYLDIDGNEREVEAHGLLSHCVQHEIDHLDGILFVDYLSKLRRSMMIRKVQKSKREGP